MKLRKFLAAFLAVLALSMPGTAPADDHGLNPLQKKGIEKIIEEYLVKNPEILVRAMDVYRTKQVRSDRDRIVSTLARVDKNLRYNPATPVGGNPKGDVTVVEFFDYRCPYCKQVFPTIMKLLKADKNIRFVFKEFPILGPDSIIAAQAAVAVWKFAPGKYMDFHRAMMGGRTKVTEASVFRLAKKIGLDPAKLRQWMRDPAVNEEIENNARIAQELGITGTPAFVFGDQIVPGAIDEATMRRLVSEDRKGKGKARQSKGN